MDLRVEGRSGHQLYLVGKKPDHAEAKDEPLDRPGIQRRYQQCGGHELRESEPADPDIRRHPFGAVLTPPIPARWCSLNVCRIPNLFIGIQKWLIMRKTILSIAILSMVSCTKKDFDINSPNPNQPSSVTPNYVLSAALTTSANLVFGGNANFANGWMGYWATYGEQSPAVLSYNFTSDFYTGNWTVRIRRWKTISLLKISPELPMKPIISPLPKS